jgi:hypothetical protein
MLPRGRSAAVAHPSSRAGSPGGHHRRVPSDVPAQPTEACPGCGTVLVRIDGPGPLHAGASGSGARLSEDTLRGLREGAGADAAAAAAVRRADAAYGAQHSDPAAPGLRAALAALGVSPGERHRPPAWRTTIADVAADLDVIDLALLVEAWARSVGEDWTAVGASDR